MKIVSCHIENFGKLHDYSLDFCGGANKICEENGWGKSTLAAFIRAMFYGLEGDRKRNIEENERKRYQPWQGGVFGGQLVFEMRGKRYLISRIFQDKEANDEFELRDADTNLPVKEYTAKIGEEIFKINRASFLRTVFIEQNQCETAPTDDIHAKIGQLADHSNDLNNFETATARLTDLINRLNPKRATGTISKRREEIAAYERIVQGGKGIPDSIEQYQEKLHGEEAVYEERKRQIREIAETQQKVSKQQSVMAKRSEWERLKRAVDKRQEEKRAHEQKFPGAIPALEDVKKKLLECNDRDRAYDRVELYRVSQAEEDELASLEDTFARGTPSDTELAEMLQDAEALKTMSQEHMAGQMSPAERQRLAELEPYFADDQESAASVIGKWNTRNTKKAVLPSKQAALMALRASMASQSPRRSQKRSPLLLIGIVLAAAGVLAALLLSPAAGIPVAAVGVVLAVIGGMAGKKAEPEQPAVSLEYEQLCREIQADEEYVARTEEEVAGYLTGHGRCFDENTASGVLQEILEESVEYASLKKKHQRSLDHTKERDMETLRRTVMAFLGRYGMASADSRFVEDLYLLKERAKKYSALKEKQNHFQKAEADYRELQERLLSFLREYGYEASDNVASQLNDIRDCVARYQNAVSALAEAGKELEQFEAAHPISAWRESEAEEPLPTLEELNQQLQQLTDDRETLQKNISSYNKTLENLQEEYDAWEENSRRLEELKGTQAQEEKKYQCVSMARKKLEQAKEVMTARYADPIFQGFRRYYEMISGQDAARFHVDANTAVTVEEWGKQRDTNTLSSGYRDLIGICLRVALVDAMYPEEEPPLILDDPFADLDDRKVAAGMDFLQKLAEKYQILYFTCSASRA